jgi:multidrug efflux pump
MVATIGFSALLALSLTPALCATLLKPVAKGHAHAARGLFGRFNQVLDAGRSRYSRVVGRALKRTGRLMLVYAALLAGLAWAFVNLPGGFLPVDDQGYVTADVQTPSDSSYARTEAAVEKVEKYLAQRAGVEDVTFLTGYSFSGQGMNTAQAFITLKEEGLRGAGPGGQPARRGGQRQSGAAEGLCRGSAGRAAAQPAGRSRKGRRVRRQLRRHQQHDLDQSRLELHQRFPEPGPDAARRRPGR